MKRVVVDWKVAEVTEFVPQTEEFTLRLLLNDGKDKASIKKLKIDSPEHIASSWLAEVRAKIKASHAERSLDDNPLTGVVILQMKQEEDVLEEKFAKFLAQIRERLRVAKLSKMSYGDMQKKLTGLSVKF